jgi:hypothetical protein
VEHNCVSEMRWARHACFMTLHRAGMTPERLRIDHRLAAIDETMGLQRPGQDQGGRPSPWARRRHPVRREHLYGITH